MNPQAGFRTLVEVMAESHETDNALPTVDEEGFQEVKDRLDMIDMNLTDEDGPEIMIQNLADLVGAAHRFAAVLLNDISPERLAAIIRENRP